MSSLLLRTGDKLLLRSGDSALLRRSAGTITKTIGTSSRDYSTITLWEADLDDTGVYTSGDAAVGECYADSDFDEAPTINGGGVVGLISVTLSVASGERHGGTANSGVRILRTSNSGVEMEDNGSIVYTVQWLEIDLNGNDARSGGIGLAASNTADLMYAKNCIVHGASNSSNNWTYGITATRVAQVMNCIVYDLVSSYSADSKDTYGIRFATGTTGPRGAYNCTVHNIQRTVSTLQSAFGIHLSTDDADFECKNCLVTDVSANGGTELDFSFPGTTVTVANNCSSDASADDAGGSGYITSVTTSNQYVSTTGGSEDLHLKSGSDCIGAGTDLGTTPTDVNIDINGRDRDAEGDTWDIGAHQFVSTLSESPAFLLLMGI